MKPTCEPVNSFVIIHGKDVTTDQATVGQAPAQIFAYLCRHCDMIHLALSLGCGNVIVADLDDDDAQHLSRQLVDPPTEEGLKL